MHVQLKQKNHTLFSPSIPLSTWSFSSLSSPSSISQSLSQTSESPRATPDLAPKILQPQSTTQ